MEGKKARIEQKITALTDQFETLGKKLAAVKKEKILETRAAEKLRLEHDIEDLKQDERAIEEELETLERELQACDSEPPAPVQPAAFASDPAGLRQDYLNWLCEQVSQMPLLSIDRKAASDERLACLNLRAIYTALLTRSSDQERPSALEFDRQDRRLSALAQLNRRQHLVLLGDPGSGKSTFVNFVAMCLSGEALGNPDANLKLLTAPLPQDDGKDDKERQPWEHGALLPVRILLRDFAANGLPAEGQTARVSHLWDFITGELRAAALDEYAPHLQRHLREQGGIVLFDGLDEVPEADRCRTQIKQVVEEFVRVFRRCRVLVTSRTYAYQQQDWRLTGFAETALASFSQGQIHRFIDQWYAYMAAVGRLATDQAQTQADELRQAILHNNRLYSLAERPLLLALMASLHAWRGGRLPDKREELYDEAVDLLLERWERRKDVSGGVQPGLTELLHAGKDQVLRVLESLAFKAHASQPDLTGTANIAERDLVNDLLHLRPQGDVKPALIVRHLSERAGLLAPHGVGVYTFLHRTFQEYLAARHLTAERDYPYNIAELARRDPNRWREVVLLAGAKAARGTASSIWQLAQKLCRCDVNAATDPTADAWGALLASQALVETADLTHIHPTDRQDVERLRNWLIAILTEQQPRNAPFPAVERALAGNLLAMFGDPRPGVGLRADGLPDIEWVDIPAGTFLMGSDPEKDRQANENEQPQHKVRVSAFQISRYPITNAQYQAFIDDGGYTERQHKYWTDEGWAWEISEQISEPRWAGGLFDLSNHPVVRVSWYEATAFCAWLTVRMRETHPQPIPGRELASSHPLLKGKSASSIPLMGWVGKGFIIRLPTEAEWEYAARGSDGRIYSWGDEPVTPEHANYDNTRLNATSAVGCFPRSTSTFGCEDMAGNVYEWCQDVWHDNYNGTPSDGSAWEENENNNMRLLKVGSWRDSPRRVRCASRYGYHRNSRVRSWGFRVVRSVAGQ